MIVDYDEYYYETWRFVGSSVRVIIEIAIFACGEYTHVRHCNKTHIRMENKNDFNNGSG